VSRNLLKLWHPKNTLDKFRVEAAFLFEDIEALHGREAAARIFAETPPTQRELNDMKNTALLARYDAMPRPSVKKLARELAEENKSLPLVQQRGSGSTKWENLERLIWNLLRARQERRLAAPEDFFQSGSFVTIRCPSQPTEATMKRERLRQLPRWLPADMRRCRWN